MTLFRRKKKSPPYPRIPYWYSWTKARQREYMFRLINTHRDAAARYYDRWRETDAELKKLQKELETK